MHAPMDPKDIILMLAATEDGNPLRDFPKDPETIPFTAFADWVRFWMGLIIGQLEHGPFQVSLEDLAEVLDGEDNPLKMLPEYELCKDPVYQVPADMTVPVPVWEEFVIWYSEAIGKYIENKQQGGNT